MKKIFIIKEVNRSSFLYSLLSVFFKSEKYEYLFPGEVVKLLNDTQPDLIFTNIERPVSGNDLMSMVSELDELSRLRVFYIIIALPKIRLFRKVPLKTHKSLTAS
jgi:two-component SAPR family response regulator